MTSEVKHESFREGNQPFAADRTRITTPAALWLETADSVFRWYGAMLRLALGVRRIDGCGDAQGLVAPPPQVKPEESSRNPAPQSLGEAQPLIASPAPAPATPAESSPVAALHSVPTAPVRRRPKRRKTASRGKNGARSSKRSSIKRHRRAA
jgi:hypothetical protein